MPEPLTRLYAAVATATPDPARPRGGHGFHHNTFTPDTSADDSTGLLLGLGAGAVVLALAAWLFLLWNQRRSRTASSATAGPAPDPASRASPSGRDNGPW